MQRPDCLLGYQGTLYPKGWITEGLPRYCAGSSSKSRTPEIISPGS